MRIKITTLSLLFVLLLLVINSCKTDDGSIFKSKQFYMYPDRVVQKNIVASVEDSLRIVSNYHIGKTTWRFTDSVLVAPELNTSSVLLNTIYRLTAEQATEIKANASLSDITYSTIMALAIINPAKCKKYLLQKVKNFNIIQNTTQSHAWPINLHRNLWGIAAWRVYCFTGDRIWLRKVFSIVKLAVDADLNVNWNYRKYLFKGSTDASNSCYPPNFSATDIFNSYSLRTQILCYRNIQLLIEMGKQLDRDTLYYQHLLKALKKSIEANFWMPEKQVYSSYIYGDKGMFKALQQDVLAEAMGIVWDIFDKKKQLLLTETMPCFNFGIPDFLPLYKNRKAKVSALTQAFWSMALAKNGCSKSVNWSMACLMRATTISLKNIDSWSVKTGEFLDSNASGIGSSSVLSFYYDVLLGLRCNTQEIAFKPFVPKELNGTIIVKQLKYKKAILNIEIVGFGNEIERCVIDDKDSEKAAVAATAIGEHKIVLYLNNKLPKQSKVAKIKEQIKLETPVLELKNDTVFWTRNVNDKKYNLFKDGVFCKSISDTLFTDTITNSYWLSVQAEGRKTQKSECSKEKLLHPGSFHRNVDAAIFQPNSTLPYALLEGNLPLDFRIRVPRDGVYRITFLYRCKASENGCITRSFWKNNNYLGTYLFNRHKNDKPAVMQTNGIEVNVFRGYNKFRLTREKFNKRNNATPDKLILEKIKIERVNK